MIDERHRHRYEVNAKYCDCLATNGFFVSGVHPETGLVEIMELDRQQHPYFIGTQAHPEFRSRLGAPAPLFQGLIAASITHKKAEENDPQNLNKDIS
jgi:CTP synthase